LWKWIPTKFNFLKS